MISLDESKIVNQAIEKIKELIEENNLPMAEQLVVQLTRCVPDDSDILNLAWMVHHKQRKYSEAITFLEKKVSTDSNDSDLYNNLALSVSCLGNITQAIEYLEKAISINPKNPHYSSNLSLQYRHLCDYDKAIKYAIRATELQDDPIFWTNLGSIYGESHNISEATKCFQKAIQIDNNLASAHVDLAYSFHLQGRWKEGWEEYEHRFEFFPQLVWYKKVYDPSKRWKHADTNLDNKTLILYCEQGYGDTINFCRYIPLLKQKFNCKVILHVQGILESLLSKQTDIAIDDFISKPVPICNTEDIPKHDYHASLLSLPHLLENYEIKGKPYINATQKASLGHEDKLKIGISWAGSPLHPNDVRRSCHLKYFEYLSKLDNVKLFSLQQNINPRKYAFNSEIIDFTEGASDIKLIDLSEFMTDFENSANLLTGLDLVITVDTALMHLAGAMGVKTIGLIAFNPDWRWGLTKPTTEWYDSITLVRQPRPNDWESVFEHVNAMFPGE